MGQAGVNLPTAQRSLAVDDTTMYGGEMGDSGSGRHHMRRQDAEKCGGLICAMISGVSGRCDPGSRKARSSLLPITETETSPDVRRNCH